MRSLHIIGGRSQFGCGGSPASTIDLVLRSLQSFSSWPSLSISSCVSLMTGSKARSFRWKIDEEGRAYDKLKSMDEAWWGRGNIVH